MKSALLKLNIAIFLWGFTGVLGRLITLNEGLLVWWRLLITVATVWLLFLFTKKKQKIPPKGIVKIGAIGGVLALHWLCFYGSIKYSNVSVALTCMSTTGLFTALLEPIFFKRRINTFEVVLGLMALCGIALIYLSNLAFSTGIYIGLSAAVFIVIVSILNKSVVENYEPQTMTRYQLTGAFVCLSLLMPLYNYLFPAPSLLPSKMDWLWLLIMCWVCTVFTFGLYLDALKKVSAFTMNLTTTMEPVYGIVLAFLIYHENKDFGFTFYIGLALIIAAVCIQLFNTVKSHRKAETLVPYEM
ncbi:MAG: EamA family transporter [Bacteroidota bacterium]|nr:EamA family transporter [Bacteroidota bacterium]